MLRLIKSVGNHRKLVGKYLKWNLVERFVILKTIMCSKDSREKADESLEMRVSLFGFILEIVFGIFDFSDTYN